MRGFLIGGIIGGAGGVVLGLVVGLIFGVIVSPYVNNLTAPADHKAIIDNMKVYDTVAKLYLTPRLADAGLKVYGQGYPLEIWQFTKGEEYEQTTWLWQRFGDTEFCMTIWGAGDDAKTYYFEVGKLSGTGFEITYLDRQVYTEGSASHIQFTLQTS